MNKTHIDPKDILDGDLIRFEYAEERFPGAVTAVEYTKSGSVPQEYTRKPGVHFLLDRPEPPYELPTEPGVYTIADSTDGIHRKRLFKLSSWRAWMEDEDTWSNREGMKVRDFLMKKKWHLKRLVIEE